MSTNSLNNNRGIQLNNAAEFVIQDLMELKLEVAEAARSCVLKYSKPDTFFETLDWIKYRIWNAVKSVFGQSDWQKTKRMVCNHFVAFAPTLTNFQTQKAKKLFENILSALSSKIAANLLSTCLVANNSWNKLTTEEARRRLQHLSFRTQLNAGFSKIHSVIAREASRRKQNEAV